MLMYAACPKSRLTARRGPLLLAYYPAVHYIGNIASIYGL
jgi:hypothetical protein